MRVLYRNHSLSSSARDLSSDHRHAAGTQTNRALIDAETVNRVRASGWRVHTLGRRTHARLWNAHRLIPELAAGAGTCLPTCRAAAIRLGHALNGATATLSDDADLSCGTRRSAARETPRVHRSPRTSLLTRDSRAAALSRPRFSAGAACAAVASDVRRVSGRAARCSHFLVCARDATTCRQPREAQREDEDARSKRVRHHGRWLRLILDLQQAACHLGN
jgi:hypothetical protein